MSVFSGFYKDSSLGCLLFSIHAVDILPLRLDTLSSILDGQVFIAGECARPSCFYKSYPHSGGHLNIDMS